MRWHNRLVGAGLLGLLGAVGGCAHPTGERHEQEQAGRKVGEATAKKAAFVDRLIQLDEEQIALGELARRNASSPQVRSLAEQLVRDHHAHLQHLQAWAEGAALHIAMTDMALQGEQGQEGTGGAGGAGDSGGADGPEAMARAGREATAQTLRKEAARQDAQYQAHVQAFLAERNALAEKHGRDFDADYLARVRTAQEEGLALVKDGMEEYGDDLALASLLGQSRPQLRDNLARTRAAEKGLE